MERLTKINQLDFECKLHPSDIKAAIDYSTVSLPWTFDRMRYGPRTQNAVNRRLINIVTGVLNQTILDRGLRDRGHNCTKEWKKYRDSDVFDFRIDEEKFDVKTNVVYSEYNETWNRPDFSPAYLIKNKSYSGPSWRRLFPQMITLSQLSIRSMKDSYIFGIAECHKDIRRCKPASKDEGFWCAAPFAKAHKFFQSKGAIRRREEEGKGFQLKLSSKVIQEDLLTESNEMRITIFGEWNSRRKKEVVTLAQHETVITDAEFSSLSTVRMDHPTDLNEGQKITIHAENHFDEHIGKSSNPKINLNDSDFMWDLEKNSFVNLIVPDDYRIHWLGHIPFAEFASKFVKYKPYFIPHPNNMDRNQIGIVTKKLQLKFNTLDRRRSKAIAEGIKIPWPQFSKIIDGDQINAGLLLVAMRGFRPIGAACYYYPPYAMQETAIYVLPKDLYTMNSL